MQADKWSEHFPTLPSSRFGLVEGLAEQTPARMSLMLPLLPLVEEPEEVVCLQGVTPRI